MEMEIILLLIIGCATAVPLLISVDSLPLPSFFNEITAILFWIFCACLFYFYGLRNKSQIKNNKSGIYLIFLWLALCASYRAFLGNPPVWAIEMKLAFVFFLCYTVSAQAQFLGTDKHCIRKFVIPLVWGIVIAAVLNAVIGFIQFFDTPFFDAVIAARPLGSRIAGNIRQANHFAFISIAGMYGLNYLYKRKKFTFAMFVALAVFLSSPIIFAQSRTGYILCSIWLGWLVYTQPKKVGLTILSITSSWMIFLYVIMDLMLVKMPVDMVLISNRVELWTNNLALLGTCWLGCGVASYSINNFVQTPERIFTIVSNNAHNLLIDTLITQGWIVAVIVFLYILYLCFKYCTRRSIKRESFFYLLSLFLYCQVEHPYAFSYFLLPNAFLIGILCRHKNMISEKNILSNRLNLKFHFTGLIALGVFILTVAAIEVYMPINSRYMRKYDGFHHDVDAAIKFQHPNFFYEHLSVMEAAKYNAVNYLNSNAVSRLSCASFWLIGPSQLIRLISWAVEERKFELAFGLLYKLRQLSVFSAERIDFLTNDSKNKSWIDFGDFLRKTNSRPDWLVFSRELSVLNDKCGE